MPKREADVLVQVRLEASRQGITNFRNNQGQALSERGVPIRYGVCNPGGSDLLGWTSIEITPEMIGRRIAVFAAIEVKRPGARLTDEQKSFIETVRSSGGLAIVAYSPEDVAGGLREWIRGRS